MTVLALPYSSKLIHTLTVAAVIASVAAAGAQTSGKPASTATKPNAAATTAAAARTAADPVADRALALQVALDRAGFSPGEIDGRAGSNTEKALRGFQQANKLQVTGKMNAETEAALGTVLSNPLATYAISAEDAAGPFVESLPADMMKKADLPALGYTSLLELLGERFHSSPALLKKLNPGAKFAAGEIINVPNVEPFIAGKSAASSASASGAGATGDRGNATLSSPGAARGAGTASGAPAPRRDPVAARDHVITVTERTKTLTLQDATGRIVFQAPVTVGSKNDPLPVGDWKVTGIARNPTFNYNPDLFWDANPAHAKAKLAPGPNNPVGTVWIDLSKEHYGIHGTPEPSRIGYTESHGCIRLTNWDAARLAAMVAAGTKVILQ